MHRSNMDASEIRCKITELLQARMSGQPALLRGYFAPNAVVRCGGFRAALLAPGNREGADVLRSDVLRSVTRLTDENYRPLDYEILDILVDGQKAVVRWRCVWRHHGTSETCMVEAAHFLRWQNGLIVEMHEFFEHISEHMPQCTRILSFKDLLTGKSPGLDRDEIERRARKLVAFPSIGPEIAVIRELCAPDIVCDFVGDRAHIPYAGRHVGIEALINIVRTVAIDFEQAHCSISEVLVEEGRVAGRREVEWSHRGTGRRGLVELANFVRFENGMIVELIEFRDSVTQLELRGDLATQLSRGIF
jgi:ketosteroid isomerase-like protein